MALCTILDLVNNELLNKKKRFNIFSNPLKRQSYFVFEKLSDHPYKALIVFFEKLFLQLGCLSLTCLSLKMFRISQRKLYYLEVIY